MCEVFSSFRLTCLNKYGINSVTCLNKNKIRCGRDTFKILF